MLNCELLAVIPEVDGELIKLPQCGWINTYAERHRPLPLAASVDADEPIFEGLRIIVGAVLDAGSDFCEHRSNVRTLPACFNRLLRKQPARGCASFLAAQPPALAAGHCFTPAQIAS
jgi:hypothetical protein